MSLSFVVELVELSKRMLNADTWVRSFEANATDAFQSMFSFTSAVGSGITAIPTLQCLTNWSFYTGVGVVAGLPVLVALLALLITLAAFLVVAFRERNSHTRPAPTTPRDGSQVEPASEATPSTVVSTTSQHWVRRALSGFGQYIKGRKFMGSVVFILFVSCKLPCQWLPPPPLFHL